MLIVQTSLGSLFTNVVSKILNLCTLSYSIGRLSSELLPRLKLQNDRVRGCLKSGKIKKYSLL